MKIKIFTFVLCFFSLTVFSQIELGKIAEEKKEYKEYDSTVNFLEDNPEVYIGQTLYLKGVPKHSRYGGYSCFTTSIIKKGRKSNTYKKVDFGSSYEEMVGLYFDVLEVTRHGRCAETLYQNDYYLKLKEKESEDIVFYRYNSSLSTIFPFVVVGYFEKLKEINIGREFVARGRNFMEVNYTNKDFYTGKAVNVKVGQIRECLNVLIEEENYNIALIIGNKKGEKVPITINESEKEHYLFDKKDAEIYREQFGDEIWDTILGGRFSIGYTEKMVRIAWGEPKKINNSSKGLDQWVYGTQYLYFENGILVSFN